MTAPTPSIAEVALSPDSRAALIRRGIAYGRCFYTSKIMKPLEKAGLMERVEQPGFRPYWWMTAAGEAVRQHLIEQDTERG